MYDKNLNSFHNIDSSSIFIYLCNYTSRKLLITKNLLKVRYNLFYEYILLHKIINKNTCKNIYTNCMQFYEIYNANDKNKEYNDVYKVKMIVDYWLEDLYPIYQKMI